MYEFTVEGDAVQPTETSCPACGANTLSETEALRDSLHDVDVAIGKLRRRCLITGRRTLDNAEAQRHAHWVVTPYLAARAVTARLRFH
jgi:hypothetical protein